MARQTKIIAIDIIENFIRFIFIFSSFLSFTNNGTQQIAAQNSQFHPSLHHLEMGLGKNSTNLSQFSNSSWVMLDKCLTESFPISFLVGFLIENHSYYGLRDLCIFELEERLSEIFSKNNFYIIKVGRGAIPVT